MSEVVKCQNCGNQLSKECLEGECGLLAKTKKHVGRTMELSTN